LLAPGTAFVYAEQPFLWPSAGEPYECLDFVVPPSMLASVTDLGTSEVRLVGSFFAQDPTLHRLALLAREELLYGGEAGGLYRDSLANLLAVHLLRRYTGRRQQDDCPSAPGLSARSLAAVTGFIREHLAEELSLVRLAALVHTSPYYFARAFKAATGQPPHRYLVERRMEEAKRLLTSTRLSMAEVARCVGYASKSQFGVQFRRYTGKSPGECRSKG
jgi:AraC family transcriptional regulator